MSFKIDTNIYTDRGNSPFLSESAIGKSKKQETIKTTAIVTRRNAKTVKNIALCVLVSICAGLAIKGLSSSSTVQDAVSSTALTIKGLLTSSNPLSDKDRALFNCLDESSLVPLNNPNTGDCGIYDYEYNLLYRGNLEQVSRIAVPIFLSREGETTRFSCMTDGINNMKVNSPSIDPCTIVQKYKYKNVDITYNKIEIIKFTNNERSESSTSPNANVDTIHLSDWIKGKNDGKGCFEIIGVQS